MDVLIDAQGSQRAVSRARDWHRRCLQGDSQNVPLWIWMDYLCTGLCFEGISEREQKNKKKICKLSVLWTFPFYPYIYDRPCCCWRRKNMPLWPLKRKTGSWRQCRRPRFVCTPSVLDALYWRGAPLLLLLLLCIIIIIIYIIIISLWGGEIYISKKTCFMKYKWKGEWSCAFISIQHYCVKPCDT